MYAVIKQTASPASFAELVRLATVEETAPRGFSPYGYQQQVDDEGFPDLITVPTTSQQNDFSGPSVAVAKAVPS